MISCSVIVPNYDHAAWLRERIDSILQQTQQPLEIILLDDASTDNSKEVLETYRDHPLVTHIIYNAKNSGSPFLQWKKGIELAKGDWIWIAESDDIADPSFLEKAAKTIAANPGTSIFYCDSIIRNIAEGASSTQRYSTIKNKLFNTDKWSHDYFNPGTDELTEGLSIRCTINNASATLLKKELLVDCLDQLAGFRFHGDWFAYLHLLSSSSICYHSEALNTYRAYSSRVQELLQGLGWDRQECFRILKYQLDHLPIRDKDALIREFAKLYLVTGLWTGKKDWLAFFKIDKALAWKLLKYKFK